MKVLRDYQILASDSVINSSSNPILCLPTGAGKTVIAFDIIKRLIEKDYTTVFVVPRLELIKQAEKEFGEVDIIWSDKTKLTGKRVIIASKDSLRTQAKKLSDVKNVVLIFDECHIGIKQTQSIIETIKPVRFIGLTATPERHDGLALLKGIDKKGQEKVHKYGCFDELLTSETVASLIARGHLSELEYYSKPIKGITDIKPTGGTDELSGEQMLEIMNKNQIAGDIVECYRKYGKNIDGTYRLAIGFAPSIAVAQVMSDVMGRAGFNMPVIHGEMSVKERESLIEQLRTHKVYGLVNASLLTYGFDCPEVSYAFSVRHIKSRPLFFQIVGRILRTFPGKENAIFIDHGDSISEFASLNCALPIIDPAIKWRVDGFLKEEKMQEKKSQKKVQRLMDLISEIDTLPCEMVKIGTEDLLDRCQKSIQKLIKKNTELEKVLEEKEIRLNGLESDIQDYKISIHQYEEQMENGNKFLKRFYSENEELKKQLKDKENEIFYLRKKIEDKNFSNKNENASSDSEKSSNDQTFEFLKKNYYWNRMKVEKERNSDEEYKKLTTRYEQHMYLHNLTTTILEELAKNKNVKINEKTWNNSCDYWFKRFFNDVA